MAATAGTACPAAARPATATRRPSLPAPAAAATPRTPSPGWNARVPPPRTAPDCMSSGALMSSVSGRALRPAYSTLRPAPVDGVSMSSKCRAGLCGDPMVADVPIALFHALGVGRAFTGLTKFTPSELGRWVDLRAVGCRGLSKKGFGYVKIRKKATDLRASASRVWRDHRRARRSMIGVPSCLSPLWAGRAVQFRSGATLLCQSSAFNRSAAERTHRGSGRGSAPWRSGGGHRCGCTDMRL